MTGRCVGGGADWQKTVCDGADWQKTVCDGADWQKTVCDGADWQEDVEGQAEVYTVEQRSFSSFSEKTAGLILSPRRQTADKIQHSALFVPAQQFFI